MMDASRDGGKSSEKSLKWIYVRVVKFTIARLKFRMQLIKPDFGRESVLKLCYWTGILLHEKARYVNRWTKVISSIDIRCIAHAVIEFIAELHHDVQHSRIFIQTIAQ